MAMLINFKHTPFSIQNDSGVMILKHKKLASGYITIALVL